MNITTDVTTFTKENLYQILQDEFIERPNLDYQRREFAMSIQRTTTNKTPFGHWLYLALLANGITGLTIKQSYGNNYYLSICSLFRRTTPTVGNKSIEMCADLLDMDFADVMRKYAYSTKCLSLMNDRDYEWFFVKQADDLAYYADLMGFFINRQKRGSSNPSPNKGRKRNRSAFIGYSGPTTVLTAIVPLPIKKALLNANRVTGDNISLADHLKIAVEDYVRNSKIEVTW